MVAVRHELLGGSGLGAGGHARRRVVAWPRGARAAVDSSLIAPSTSRFSTLLNKVLDIKESLL